MCSRFHPRSLLRTWRRNYSDLTEIIQRVQQCKLPDPVSPSVAVSNISRLCKDFEEDVVFNLRRVYGYRRHCEEPITFVQIFIDAKLSSGLRALLSPLVTPQCKILEGQLMSLNDSQIANLALSMSRLLVAKDDDVMVEVLLENLNRVHRMNIKELKDLSLFISYVKKNGIPLSGKIAQRFHPLVLHIRSEELADAALLYREMCHYSTKASLKKTGDFLLEKIISVNDVQLQIESLFFLLYTPEWIDFDQRLLVEASNFVIANVDSHHMTTRKLSVFTKFFDYLNNSEEINAVMKKKFLSLLQNDAESTASSQKLNSAAEFIDSLLILTKLSDKKQVFSTEETSSIQSWIERGLFEFTSDFDLMHLQYLSLCLQTLLKFCADESIELVISRFLQLMPDIVLGRTCLKYLLVGILRSGPNQSTMFRTLYTALGAGIFAMVERQRCSPEHMILYAEFYMRTALFLSQPHFSSFLPHLLDYVEKFPLLNVRWIAHHFNVLRKKRISIARMHKYEFIDAINCAFLTSAELASDFEFATLDHTIRLCYEMKLDPAIVHLLVERYGSKLGQLSYFDIHKVIDLLEKYGYYNQGFLQRCLERLISDFPRAVVDAQSPVSVASLLDLLQRIAEIGMEPSSEVRSRFRELFVTIQSQWPVLSRLSFAYSLALLNCSSQECCEDIFNVHFLKKLDATLASAESSQNQNVFLRHLVVMNRIACIEFPQLNLPWFVRKHSKIINEAEMKYTEQNRFHKLFEIVLNDIVSNELTKNCAVLPFDYLVDFEICVVDKQKFVHPDSVSDVKSGSSYRRLAIMAIPKERVYENHTEHDTGDVRLKVKHLKMLGYSVLKISEADFRYPEYSSKSIWLHHLLTDRVYQ